MKKVFLFLLAATTLISCGSDDEDATKRPSLITLQGAGQSYAFNMTFDKGRLATMTSNVDGASTYAFSYNDKGKVSTVAMSGTDTGTISFTYNTDGKLATVTYPGAEPLTATWAGDTNVTIDGMTYTFDAKGDLLVYDTATFMRENGKGAFASVKNFDMLTLLLVEPVTLYFANKRPTTSVTGDGTAITFTNQSSGGYISSSMFTVGSTVYSVNYMY